MKHLDLKKGIILITYGILLTMVIIRWNFFSDMFSYVSSILAPFIYGVVLAFLVNGPYEFFRQKVFRRLAEKKAIEDARFVLPNACNTKMICTLNARSLMNFFTLRCCNRAQWEIRDVADQMFQLVYAVAPKLFQNAGPSCVRGACSEGKMSCGKMKEVRQRFGAMREQCHGKG